MGRVKKVKEKEADHFPQIEWVEINEVRPNPANPNRHSIEQVERLSELIRFYGWRQPLIVSVETGLLIVGHGRLLAAKRLKHTHVPVLRQSFRSREEEYGFMVADNAIGEWSDSKLDLSMINVVVPEMGPDFNVNLLGMKDFQIEAADKYSSEEEEKRRCPKCGQTLKTESSKALTF